MLGQLRFDAIADEPPLTAGQRLLEQALDASLGDRQLFDAALLEVLLELAVGDGRHLLLDRQQVLQAEKHQNGDHPVIHVELSSVFHTCSPCAADGEIMPAAREASLNPDQ